MEQMNEIESDIDIETTTQWICKRCDYDASTKSHLIRHLTKQKTCTDKREGVKDTIEEYIKELTTKIYNDKTYDCEYCGKKFNSCPNKSRHKKTCKQTPINLPQTNTSMTLKEQDIQQEMDSNCSINIHSKTSELHRLVDDIIAQQNNEIVSLKKELEKTKSMLNTTRLEMAFLKRKKNEDFYQALMEQHFNATHKNLDSGITDITTADAHYEIKRWSCWKEAYAQLILYNDDDPKEHMYACFFEMCSDKLKNKVHEKFIKYNIKCLEFREDDNCISLCDLISGEIKFTYTFPDSI